MMNMQLKGANFPPVSARSVSPKENLQYIKRLLSPLFRCLKKVTPMKAQAEPPHIVWFRRDLRLADNPALHAAHASGAPLILLYILDASKHSQRALGGASNWWLDKSLQSLDADIQTRGGTLTYLKGDPETILHNLIARTGAKSVYWNRRYDQPSIARDKKIKSILSDQGLSVKSFNASLLTEPWTYQTGSKSYYKVFSPYWRRVQADYEAPTALPAPKTLTCLAPAGDTLNAWGLHPVNPDWSTEFTPIWQPGEAGARKRLRDFLSGPINQYQEHRNRPDITTGTSGLSPHLAFGEIGPAQIWRAAMHHIQSGKANDENARVFLSEIAWREFSYVLLFHNPDLATSNYNKSFDVMPWREDDNAYAAWCYGRTGYPMVDAGMRQLWQTGWMHNRVRMIVASFLTKHLLINWTRGEDWFWDTLVDADPAANAASWQWTAGSGADAAPYFRVFNPITQGSKFDITGDYVRTYCPELAQLPTQYIHRPWDAPPLVLESAGVTLGETYPHPIVEHKIGRERALGAYNELKQKREAAKT